MEVLLLSTLLFLFVTVLIGISQSRDVDTFESFALSRGFFGKYTILFTIVASFVGGGTIIGTANETFSTGIVYVVGLSGFAVQLVLTGFIIAPRFQKFSNFLSLGDIVRQSYGQKAQVLMGVFWLIFCVGIIAVQIKSLGLLFSMFVPLSPTINALIGASIVIGYCTFGGIRAVVATDVFQFVMMIITLPLLLFFALNSVGGLDGFLMKVPEEFITLPGLSTWPKIITLFLSFLFADALIPPVVQRLLMVQKPSHAKLGYGMGSIITLGLVVMAGMFGMIAHILNPTMQATGIINYLAQTVLPLWGMIIVVFGLMAVIMSSADSYLNSAAVALVNDIMKPLRRDISQKELLTLGKMTTLVIGLCAFCLTLIGGGILPLLLYTFKFWGPMVLPQILAIFFGKTHYAQAFFASCAAGALVVVGWEVFDLEALCNMDSLIPGIVANGLAYILMHKKCA
jgi:SSS family solute:Na+ symporter